MKKKLFATVVTLSMFVSLSIPVYALTPADLTAKSTQDVRISDVYNELNFDYLDLLLKQAALKEAETEPSWAILSLNNHQGLQFYYFPDRSSDEALSQYEELVNTSDESIDFIQFGSLIDSSSAVATQDSFTENPAKAAVQAISTVGSTNVEEKLYSDLNSSNLPIYWNIEKTNSDTFSLEVAIGKYVIQPGDCLSVLAERYDTTVGQLLDDNQNIINPDLIYTEDYLVIK